MGKIGDILIGAGILGAVTWGINALIKSEKEEKRRKSIPCVFSESLTENDFEEIVVSEAKKIKRVRVEVNGHIVCGRVTAVSGLSEWNFILDYNNYGSVTGKYWLKSDNNDSSIPSVLGDRIKEAIEASV